MILERTTALDLVEREQLRGIVEKLRRLLTTELTRTLEATFGIRRSGPPEEESRLQLDPDQLLTRRALVGLWEALDQRSDRLIREAAFTHANRLIAIRIAEAIGLLPPSIAQGRRSSGFRQLLEVAPLLGSDDDAGYWRYLQFCGDELAHDVPRLFDPRNPLLALRPPPGVIDDLTGILVSADEQSESLWRAPDTLGWAYQFFNTDEDRAGMRKKAAPSNSWELAVRNQFFTPEYVVRFLVHNSLGRRLVESGVAPDLEAQLDMLVDVPSQTGESLDLHDIRVLDPACGSGHFLLGAYDVLEAAWATIGVNAHDAAARIVPCLWGIEIDARAAQVASAAVLFRARRSGFRGALDAPNIICARALPADEETRGELLASVDPTQREFLLELISELDRAPDLGSLLKLDEMLDGDTARRMTFGGGTADVVARQRPKRVEAGSPTLMDVGLADGRLDVLPLVQQVLGEVQAAADRVQSTAAERVLAADAGDGLRLIEALGQRYHAVLMNPPFGEPIPATKPYLKAAYPWVPTKDHNLYAVFVGRGLELCRPDGYLGAITSRAGMFLSTFQRWRAEVLLANRFVAMADLGHKVMHDALVEAAAYVVSPDSARRAEPAIFLRLLREAPETRPKALGELCELVRGGGSDDRVFRAGASDFDAIPGSPMAYWMTPDVRALFEENPALEGHGAEVRQGLATGDDFRFVRAFWEVSPQSIARSRDETLAGKRWVPFAKGGEYSPFWSDVHLLVDYERDGERIRAYPGSRPQNLQYFFLSGLTWPLRTASGFGPRIFPSGAIFGHKGPVAVALGSPGALLGWLTSRVASSLLAVQLGAGDETSSGGASKSYEVGMVAKIPWPAKVGADQTIEQLALEAAGLVRQRDHFDETTRAFVAPELRVDLDAATIRAAIDRADEQSLQIIERSAQLEARILKHVGDQAIDFVDEEIGRHPSSLSTAQLDDPEVFAEVYPLPIAEIIKRAVQIRGPAREITQKNFVAERRIEVLSHAFNRHPNVISNERRRLGLVPADEARSHAADLLSYLLGCAFGRWDVRVGTDPATAPTLDPDPFAPVPVCPPGMLVDADGFPATTQPAGYPMSVAPLGLLVDEPGHDDDVVAAIEQAAGVIVGGDPRNILDQLVDHLGSTDLRTHLRKRFFTEHLGRYSKSRRKAPIYWPVTSGSRDWTVWICAPRMTRETLFAIDSHVTRRLGLADRATRRLESEQLQVSTPGSATHDPSRSREVAAQLDRERRLIEELRVMQRTTSPITRSGWEPDLDDGLLLCAAPFASVFPDWAKDLDSARAAIRDGKHEWATVHRYREML